MSTNSRLTPLVRPLTAGLAVASTAASASAAIIHSETPISFSGGLNSSFNASFDLDGGNADFSVHLDTGYAGKNGMFTSPSTFSISGMNGNQVTTGELGFGDLVGSSSSFTTGAFTVPIDGTNHLIGFALNSGSTPLYGWMSVIHIGGNGDGNGKVTAWAYDDTGAPITAGQTSIPEPASLATVAALLAGSAAVWKRRRQKLEAAAIAA